jgi:hypothetical protein
MGNLPWRTNSDADDGRLATRPTALWGVVGGGGFGYNNGDRAAVAEKSVTTPASSNFTESR